MQLVLDTQGLILKQHNRSFLIIGKTKKAKISPHRIDSIAVTAACMLTTTAIKLAVKHKIPIHIISPSGEIVGTLWSPYLVGLASQRKAQVYWSDSKEALLWVLETIGLKIERQANLLQELGNSTIAEALQIHRIKLMELQEAKAIMTEVTIADFEKVRQTIFGLEGTAARLYWAAISDTLPKGWQFQSRSRRPAKDAFNASLNYLYGMMYGTVELAIFTAGLDPYMGILHTEAYNRSAFTFDCIEPFRPWVDELLIACFQTGTVEMSWFIPKGEGWWLGKKGRAWLIPQFNDFLLSQKLIGDHQTTVRNHIHTFAGELAQQIKKK